MSKPKVGSLFSGVGGLDLAVEEFFDAVTVWHCEFDAEPSKVLAARWPGVPNLGDVTAVDWSQVEPVDVLCGGFPCQDLSLAGRRAGMRPGTRSGLWADFVTAIRELKPSVVVIENVRGLLSGCAESDLESCPGCVGDGEHRPVLRALGRVLGDLDGLGFDAEWTGLRAADVGAPHGRFRVFIVAYARGVRLGAGWHATPGEASGGWSLGEFGGRDGAPVELLRTPVADELGGGPLHPDVAKERGATLRLTGQILALGGHLLPTPLSNDATGGSRNQRGEPSLARTGLSSWGPYEAAVRRWEALTRPAPAPTLPDGKNGNHRLSDEFCEWLMGYPLGWVTDVIGRKAAIKACGNGVVPQQALAALTILWPRVTESLGVAA